MVSRAIASLGNSGAPLCDEEMALLGEYATRGAEGVAATEELLANHVLMQVEFDDQGYATSQPGIVDPELVERGWRTYLVRLANPHAHTLPLDLHVNPLLGYWNTAAPGQMSAPMSLAQLPFSGDRVDNAGLVRDAWLQAELPEKAPLSGFPVEYRAISLYSSAGEARRGYLALLLVPDDKRAVFSGMQGHNIDFTVAGSYDVRLGVRDDNGLSCVASLTVTDALGRVYPPQVMRVAPDMRFHPQVYRADGETLRLPAGRYTVEARRGPEYLPVRTTVDVVDGNSRIDITLRRWIDTEKHGWYAGDPHIHAAGCSHYEVPTEGVRPETMIRHVRGEALSIGGVQAWGPGYYHQKQYFTGTAISPEATLEYPKMQNANNQVFETVSTDQDNRSTLRYDIECSGFPSSHLGHLMCLGLRDQEYPGAEYINDWPSWTQPIERWAKEQGAVVGFTHCGLGLGTSSEDLPNFEMPAFNSVGTNAGIVDVTRGLCDFISGAETSPAAEMTAWYHMLNCGYRVAFLGESDYPCIFDERPGVGRTYVKLKSPPRGDMGWRAWLAGLAAGHLYFGDGRTHFIDFTVAGAGSGSTVNQEAAGPVEVCATVAVYLEPEVTEETKRIQTSPRYAKPAWHADRARLGNSRTVPVEVVVNGHTAAVQTITADGTCQKVSMNIDLAASSWIALRVLPSGHTHPVFIEVGGRPIRGSRRSAEWCRRAVDVLWEAKAQFVRESELSEAAEAFDYARRAYEKIAVECAVNS